MKIKTPKTTVTVTSESDEVKEVKATFDMNEANSLLQTGNWTLLHGCVAHQDSMGFQAKACWLLGRVRLLPFLLAALLCGCQTGTQPGITPSQISLITATAVSAAVIAGQITPAISNDLTSAAIAFSVMSRGTNITSQQVIAQVSRIQDARVRAGVMLGVGVWQMFATQAGADVAAGLAAVSDGIMAGLGQPPIERSKAKRGVKWQATGAREWRAR